MPDITPVEPVGLPKEPETPDTLEALRSDVEALKTGIKTDVVNAFREELKQLQKPNTDKIPAPEIQRDSGIRVTGLGTDVLYRSLPEFEKPYRNHKSDQLAQQWLLAARLGHREKMERVSRELNDMYRANEITEGTSSATGGIGSGTGAELVPFPVAASIVEYRNRAAKIRALAEIFTSPNQSLRIPRHGRMTGELVAEGNSASNTGADFDSILLDKKKIQVRVSVTDELLEDSAFNLVTFFTRRGGAAIGQMEDELITGFTAGFTNPLQSIAGETRITPVNAFSLLGPKDLARQAFGLPEQYAGNARWAGNAKALEYVSTLLDSSNRPITTNLFDGPAIVTDAVPGNRGVLYGRPVVQLPFTTSGTGKADIWFGDFSNVAILDGGGIRVRVSEHVEFNSGRVVWKIEERMDAAVTLPEAFSRMTVSGTTA
jgi:HK97 family phage major capsid protein